MISFNDNGAMYASRRGNIKTAQPTGEFLTT